GGEVRRTGRSGNGPRGWPTTGSQNRASFTPGQMRALQSDTQGGSRMPELGPYGSVRGARGNSRPLYVARSKSPVATVSQGTFSSLGSVDGRDVARPYGGPQPPTHSFISESPADVF